MADRFGINQEIIVLPETTYGTAVTAFDATMTKHQNLTFNYEPGVQVINTLIRNSSLVKSSCEDKAGRHMPTVTISGDLTKQNAAWLFGGITLDASQTTDFSIAGQKGNYSYQFLQYDTVTDTANIFTGCTMESLSFTRESDKWTFTATYRGKEITRDVDLSGWTGEEPIAVCEEQALFLNTTCSSAKLPTSVTGFTLTLTNNFVDDDTIFLNSATRAKEVVTGTTGTLELSYIVTAGAEYSSKIMDDTDGIAVMSMITTFTAGSLTIVFGGKIMNSTEPDPERNRFIGNLSLEMIKSDTVTPLVVVLALS